MAASVTPSVAGTIATAASRVFVPDDENLIDTLLATPLPADLPTDSSSSFGVDSVVRVAHALFTMDDFLG